MAVTINKDQIKRDVDAAWAMKDDEIFRLLGLAQMGTRNVIEATKSMKFVMAAVANTNAAVATASVSGSLEAEGKSFFEELWEKIKEIICQIYSEKLPIDGKDLVAYLVAAIVAAGAITNALAVLVITIAIKKGLDKMCGAKSK
jgi:hypothetical protein